MTDLQNSVEPCPVEQSSVEPCSTELVSTVYISKPYFCNLYFVFELTPSTPAYQIGISLYAIESKSNLAEILHIDTNAEYTEHNELIVMNPSAPVTAEGMEELLRVKVEGKVLNLSLLREYIAAACYIGADINDIPNICPCSEDIENISKVPYLKDELLLHLKYFIKTATKGADNECYHMIALKKSIMQVIDVDHIISVIGLGKTIKFLTSGVGKYRFDALMEIPKWAENAKIASRIGSGNFEPSISAWYKMLNSTDLINRLVRYRGNMYYAGVDDIEYMNHYGNVEYSDIRDFKDGCAVQTLDDRTLLVKWVKVDGVYSWNYREI